MFINFSNHPSSLWSQTQLEATKQYGDIIDIPFPQVDPLANEIVVDNIANEYCNKILEYHPNAIMVQGEMTLCFKLITKLKENNIKVLCACSQREIIENINKDGKAIKKSVFEFIQYREY